jgi:hypothetical protein
MRTGPHRKVLRSADIAARSGRSIHRLAEFQAVSQPPVSISGAGVGPRKPENLPSDLLSALYAGLASTTGS